MKKRNLDLAMKLRRINFDKLHFSRILLAVVAVGAVFLVGAALFTGHGKKASAATTAYLCSLTGGGAGNSSPYNTPIQLEAILHYATTPVVPQQNLAEVKLSFNVLKDISPCNLLVFGLGHDSLMWAGLNPHGTTVFLEEDPRWMKAMSDRHPSLKSILVKYNTQLSEADDLLAMARDNPDCAPDRAHLGSNSKCRLILPGLPEEIYDKEWDVIMIDAPRGYFDEAPGRMGAIFTAAVMARRRTKPGLTHVYLHDVNRRVEKMYGMEFLCMSYKVEVKGRLWHFAIPPATNSSQTKFCP